MVGHQGHKEERDDSRTQGHRRRKAHHGDAKEREGTKNEVEEPRRWPIRLPINAKVLKAQRSQRNPETRPGTSEAKTPRRRRQRSEPRTATYGADTCTQATTEREPRPQRTETQKLCDVYGRGCDPELPRRDAYPRIDANKQQTWRGDTAEL